MYSNVLKRTSVYLNHVHLKFESFFYLNSELGTNLLINVLFTNITNSHKPYRELCINYEIIHCFFHC